MDEFTELVALEPTMPVLAPRVSLVNAARASCIAHGRRSLREEGYIDADGVSCARLVCMSPQHAPGENTLGWYPVPGLA